MRTRQELFDFFQGDQYVLLSSIEIGEVSETEASAFVLLSTKHLNAGNSAQGGLIYTLMDFAFALLANRNKEVIAVTQSASLSYLNSPKGARLTAVAKLLKEGKTTVVSAVSVVDDKGVAVAEGIFNGFRKAVAQ